MSTSSGNSHPRDRRTDQAPPTGARAGAADAMVRRHKPPVLRRSTLRAICAIWLLLVAYGTLGPLGYGEGSWLAPVEDWHWVPPTHAINYSAYNDLFTNVLVYVPVGIALALLLRRRGGAHGLELLLAMVLAVALSYLTELLQQFMPARCSDRGDLMVNSTAALLGCLIAPRAQRTIRRGHEYVFEQCYHRPWLAAAWVMTGVTLALMTLPWDFYWPSIETEYDRSFDLLDFRRFATFGLLGFLIAMAMIERHGRQSLAFGEAVKRIFVCSVMFEAAQIFVKSHACGLLDISTALLGGLAGIGAARWLSGMSLPESSALTIRRQRLTTWALFALVAFGLIAGMYPGAVPANIQKSHRLLQFPFQVEFLESFDRVVIGVAEALFMYATVTMLCLYLTRGRGRLVALLLLLGMVGTVEAGQILLRGAPADVTPLLMAVAAWMIAIRCWNAFVPPALHTARHSTRRTSLRAQVRHSQP
jgi:VanZ family protein